MSIINSIPPMMGASGASGASGFVIEGSGKFDGTSGYLSRTPSGASNRTTWTFHVIAKRFNSSGDHQLFEAGSSSGTRNFIQYNSAGKATIASRGPTTQLDSAALFRDPSAWHDLLFVWDTSNSTAADRVKIYSNGVRLTDLATDTQASTNLNSIVNTAIIHTIGRASWTAANFGNYALARVALIDGQALTPSSFGETTDDGYWQINDISELTFGTNGFLLEGGTNVAAGVATGGSLPIVTSYTNTDGSGNRTGTITATTTVSLSAGTINNLVDGGVGQNATDSIAYGAISIDAGDYFRFQFSSARYISDIDLEMHGTASSNGQWKWQGSNDASAWTDLATFTWNHENNSAQALSNVPATGFIYYQLIEDGTSQTFANQWFSEVKFKIAETLGAVFTKSGTITATNDSPTNGDA